MLFHRMAYLWSIFVVCFKNALVFACLFSICGVEAFLFPPCGKEALERVHWFRAGQISVCFARFFLVSNCLEVFVLSIF